MATKPFLLVMNKYEYDPLAPVNTPKVLTPGATTDPTIPKLQPVVASQNSGATPAATKEMDPAVIAAIVGGAVTIGTSIANYVQQRKLQKRQEEYQKEYFDYTFNKQTSEKWNEIAYNDPFQQMQRLKNAGLNENLMYGTLGNVAGASGTAPANAPSGLSGNAPTAAPYFDTGSVIQGLLSPLQAMSQIDLNRSQSFKNYKSGGLDDVEATRRSLLTPFEVDKMDQEIKQLWQMRVYYEALTGNEVNKNTQFSYYLPFIQDFYENQLEEIKMRNSESYSRIMLNAWQSQQIQESLAYLLPSQVNLNKATAKERLATAYQIYSLTPEQKQEIANRAKITQKQLDYYLYNYVIGPILLGGISAGAKLGATAMLVP